MHHRRKEKSNEIVICNIGSDTRLFRAFGVQLPVAMQRLVPEEQLRTGLQMQPVQLQSLQLHDKVHLRRKVPRTRGLRKGKSPLRTGSELPRKIIFREEKT